VAKSRSPGRPAVLSNWDEIQLDPVTVPPDDFSGLSQDDAVEQITDWFLANFEDPANSTPYETAEGGYQYIWGGPYDARDVIENVFADTASEEMIAAAVEFLERTGHEWAPNDGRIQPPDDDPPDIRDRDTLYANMLQRIADLERALDKVSAPGIGHNCPPEPIEEAALAPTDQQDIRRLLAVLKKQLSTPPAADIPALEAEAEKLDGYGKRIRSWLADRGNDFATEAAKEAGKEAGKWAVRLALWGAIVTLLTVYHAATAWLAAAF
jgi:hypothetical protein